MAIQLNYPRRRWPSLRAVVFTSAVSLSLFATGCSKTACFEWSKLEGACPAQNDALEFFEEPSCHYSEIKSVDSEGTFDDDACCYEVTEWGSEERTFICQ